MRRWLAHAPKPRLTSTANTFQAFGDSVKAIYANVPHNREWTGRRLFHQTFSPPASAGCCLRPLAHMYIKPKDMQRATKDMGLRNFGYL